MAGLLVLALAACGPRAVVVPPTPAAVGLSPGVWAVSVVGPKGEPGPPPAPLTRGRAAGSGALTGAAGSLYGGAKMAATPATASPPGLVLAAAFLAAGVVLAPVAAVAGAIAGAATAASPEEVAVAAASVESALGEQSGAEEALAGGGVEGLEGVADDAGPPRPAGP